MTGEASILLSLRKQLMKGRRTRVAEADIETVLALMKLSSEAAIFSHNTKHPSHPTETIMVPIDESFVVEDDSFEANVLAQMPLTFDEIRCCDYPEQHLTETTSKDASPLKYKRKRSKLERHCRNFLSTQVKNAGTGSRNLATDARDQSSLSGGNQTPITGQAYGDIGLGLQVVTKSVPRAKPQGINFYKYKRAAAKGKVIHLVRPDTMLIASRGRKKVQRSLSGGIGMQISEVGQVGAVGSGSGVLNKSLPRATPQCINFNKPKTATGKGEVIVAGKRCDTTTASGKLGQGVTQIKHSLSGGMQIPGTGQVVAYVGSGSRETRKNDLNESAPRAAPRGINFYKRIGRWAAHLWAEGKQHYIGSYPSASEAASAYDKASLKHFPDSKNALDLNYERTDYLNDQAQMDAMTNEEYRNLLREQAKVSKPNHIAEGITLCPKGWYEVKIRVEVRVEEKAPPKKKVKTQKVNAEGVPIEMIWLFLGRFHTLEDAQELLRKSHPLG